MRSILPPIVVVWLFALAGCGSERPPAIGAFFVDGGMTVIDTGNDLGLQTFDIVPIDVVARDVPQPDVPIVVGAPCTADSECSLGAVCLQGRCAVNSCLTTDGSSCGGGGHCALSCVPTVDLCAGMICPTNTTCYQGRCQPGCFVSPCAGVTCPTDQFCDDSLGACAPLHPCTAACDPGYACHVRCLPPSPCDGVTCPPGSGQVCDNGTCVDNPCASVTCAAGSLCVAGVCIDTCTCAPACTRSPRDHCVVGQCICNRTCTAASMCGDDDGCGGHCVGACANPHSVCDRETKMCVCMPRVCAQTDACGSSDGCGGQCTGGCDNGFVCDVATSSCVCAPHCPTAEDVANTACGVVVPNICTGGPPCGTGLRCPSEQHCDGTACVSDEEMHDASDDHQDASEDHPDVPSDADVPAVDAPVTDADTCPAGRTLCGASCFNLQTNPHNCGACGNECPAVTACVDGACVCPASSLALCGGRCVNTQSDNGNCGACGNACAALTECSSGSCGCVPHCTMDPGLVPCGTPISNACSSGPSCGLGTQCTEGSFCSSTTHACVCFPACPAGVACGVFSGCTDPVTGTRGTCPGACGSGQACALDPDHVGHPEHYFCSATACGGGCARGQHCDPATNACVGNVCVDGTRPCPFDCCPLGQRCIGGNTCMIIPP